MSFDLAPAAIKALTCRNCAGRKTPRLGDVGVLGGDCRIHARLILTSSLNRSTTLIATHMSASTLASGGESDRTTASQALTTFSEYDDIMSNKSWSFEPRSRYTLPVLISAAAAMSRIVVDS